MCGVIGILNYNETNIIVKEVLNGIKLLRNRGRDSYGLLLSSPKYKLVFKQEKLITINDLKGEKDLLENTKFNLALGHSRYATSYQSKENKTDTNFFPRIFINDPVAKFYRARVGDVIMMQRKTGTTTTLIREQIVYRKVVYAISKDVRK